VHHLRLPALSPGVSSLGWRPAAEPPAPTDSTRAEPDPGPAPGPGGSHLVRRFVGALRPGGPPSAREAWVAGLLGSGELVLWGRMSGPDRRHGVAVARRAEALLGGASGPAAGSSPGVPPPSPGLSAGSWPGSGAGSPSGSGAGSPSGSNDPGVVDPGVVDPGVIDPGVVDRAVLAAALLHDVGKVASGLGTLGRVPATLLGTAGGRSRAAAWASRPGGARSRVGRYLLHAPLGASMLEEAGADPLTVAWAREHHLPARSWTVPGAVGAALKAADDD